MTTAETVYETSYDVAPCEARIEGVVVQALKRHGDSRGGFTETYRTEWFPGPVMLQGNRSDSAAGTIRADFGRERHGQPVDGTVL